MIGVGTTIFLVNPATFGGGGGTSYLLDTYSAAAAYSLRQLKTGVTSVVRVRRSSDNAESDFTATEITDGTLTTWTGANDGFVVTWYDQSGNSNDAIQATASSQPKLVSSGVVETSTNGLPAYLCDGTNDHLDLTSTKVLGSSSSFGTFVSVYNRSTTGIQTKVVGQDGGSSFYGGSWNTSNNYNYRAGTGGNIALLSGDTTTGDLIDFCSYDGSNFNLWFNGTSKGATAYVIGTTSNWTVINRAVTTYHNGHFQELIYFDSDQESNRADIESDINTYYSIY